MFLKNQKIRRFEYSPRCFKPGTEDEEDHRIRFRRLIERKTVRKRSPVVMVVLIVMLIFLIHYLFNIKAADKKNAPIQELRIEMLE